MAKKDFFNPPTEMNVNVFDPKLAIKLPTPVDGGEYIISKADQNGPTLEDARKAWKERNPQ